MAECPTFCEPLACAAVSWRMACLSISDLGLARRCAQAVGKAAVGRLGTGMKGLRRKASSALIGGADEGGGGGGSDGATGSDGSK